jgi:hypothetical protein
LELWNTPTAYDYYVRMRREQLPIKDTFEGMPWCTEDIAGGWA